MEKLNRLVLVLASVFSFTAHAYLENEKTPACMDGNQEVQIDNEQVLVWKKTTKNQYLDRGYVSGTVSKLPFMKNGHSHFFIKIGPGAKDNLEIIYNVEFGSMPKVKMNETVIVCGDYITSTKPTGRYEASPAGAIIHWIHWNPANRASSKKHEHGFIQFGSNLVGFDDAPESAWSGRVGGRGAPSGRADESNNAER